MKRDRLTTSSGRSSGLVSRQFRFPGVRVGKPLAFCVLAIPLVLLGVDVWREFQLPGSGLGPDPGEEVVHHLGTWGLRTLLLTLAVSPASRLLKRPQLVRYRRMVGLWAFTYLVLHFLSYFWLLGGFAVGVAIDGRRLGFAEALIMDIYKRPYITAGFLALVLLTPLAVTSTRGWQRRLRRRWKTLHRLVYPAAIGAWTHLLWLSKGSFMDPFVYGLVLVVLFGERIAVRIRKQGTGRAAAAK